MLYIVNIRSPVNKPLYTLHSANFAKMRQLISNVDWEDTPNIILKCIPLEVTRPKKNIYVTQNSPP